MKEHRRSNTLIWKTNNPVSHFLSKDLNQVVPEFMVFTFCLYTILTGHMRYSFKVSPIFTLSLFLNLVGSFYRIGKSVRIFMLNSKSSYLINSNEIYFRTNHQKDEFLNIKPQNIVSMEFKKLDNGIATNVTIQSNITLDQSSVHSRKDNQLHEFSLFFTEEDESIERHFKHIHQKYHLGKLINQIINK